MLILPVFYAPRSGALDAQIVPKLGAINFVNLHL